MIRYLLDELHTYEEDHSDALCPIDREVNQSLFGEAAKVRPMTVEEGEQLATAQVNAVRQLLLNYTPPAPSFTHPSYHPGSFSHSPSPLSTPPIVHSFPAALSPATRPLPWSSYSPIPSSLGSFTPPPPLPIQPLETAAVIIPDLGQGGWKQAVRDWECADPTRNHHRPLKDMKERDPQAYKALGPANQMKYTQRKRVAEEFITR